MVKKIFYLFVLFTCVQVNFIANCQSKCDSVNAKIDRNLFINPSGYAPPSVSDILKIIGENLKYPETARNAKIEGTVRVRFWIDTLGRTSEHEIIYGIRDDFDEEALRVARLIKFDKPAMLDNKPIGECFSLPIRFRLSDTSSVDKGLKKWFKRRK